MKNLRIVAVIILLAPLTACYHRQLSPIDILPVPPKDSRWEGATPDHIQLPLSTAGRTELVTSLRYGLSHNNQERNSAVEPNPEKTYGKLLDLLGQNVTLADLAKPEFQTWFSGERVDQVVDAREERTFRSQGPVAYRGAPSDGKYWWIFYRDADDHLTGVMLVKLQALTRLVEKRK